MRPSPDISIPVSEGKYLKQRLAGLGNGLGSKFEYREFNLIEVIVSVAVRFRLGRHWQFAEGHARRNHRNDKDASADDRLAFFVQGPTGDCHLVLVRDISERLKSFPVVDIAFRLRLRGLRFARLHLLCRGLLLPGRFLRLARHNGAEAGDCDEYQDGENTSSTPAQ